MEVFNVAVIGSQTKEGFIRDSLVELYSACDAPETIDSIELQEVDESDYQFLSCSAEFEGEYTAEIGYDRKEQYLEEVSEYNAELKRRVSRTVVKERTVTDWRPHSGKFHKSGVSLKPFGNNDAMDLGDLDPEVAQRYGHYSYDAKRVLSGGTVKADEETLAKYAFGEPSDQHLAAALAEAESDAESAVRWELPGDHYRNFRPDTNVKEMNFNVFAIKRFKTAFDFMGKTHFLKQFATEPQPTIYCSAMNSDEEANMLRAAEQKELDTDPIIQENKKYATYGMYAFLGCLGFAFLFGFGLPMIFDFSGVIPFILGAIGAVVSYFVSSRFQKKVDAQKKIIQDRFSGQKNEHFRKLQEKKIGLLNARLRMMGQAPLSETELKRFAADNKHQLDANYK